MATKVDIANLRSEMTSPRADVASDLLALEARQEAQHKQTREQIVGLRRTVVEYHTSVTGHGIIISDLSSPSWRGGALRRLEPRGLQMARSRDRLVLRDRLRRPQDEPTFRAESLDRDAL